MKQDVQAAIVAIVASLFTSLVWIALLPTLHDGPTEQQFQAALQGWEQEIDDVRGLTRTVEHELEVVNSLTSTLESANDINEQLAGQLETANGLVMHWRAAVLVQPNCALDVPRTTAIPALPTLEARGR